MSVFRVNSAFTMPPPDSVPSHAEDAAHGAKLLLAPVGPRWAKMGQDGVQASNMGESPVNSGSFMVYINGLWI
jgi:hypothetical protein